jgi:hypothetical protein
MLIDTLVRVHLTPSKTSALVLHFRLRLNLYLSIQMCSTLLGSPTEWITKLLEFCFILEKTQKDFAKFCQSDFKILLNIRKILIL